MSEIRSLTELHSLDALYEDLRQYTHKGAPTPSLETLQSWAGSLSWLIAELVVARQTAENALAVVKKATK